MTSENITWKDKLHMWKDGIPQSYPKNISKRFFYKTSICDKHLEKNYKEKYIISSQLNYLTQDFTPFIKYIKSSNNNYVTSFYNLSGDTLLVIPMPRKNKDFTTIKDFMDNATYNHQVIFWQFVTKVIEILLKYNDNIYVSTHGLGVSYFHLRLSLKPKYY